MDEEEEAREGGDLGKDGELIRRGGDDTVDAAGGRCGGGGGGGRRGARHGDRSGPGGHPGRARGGTISAGSRR